MGGCEGKPIEETKQQNNAGGSEVLVENSIVDNKLKVTIYISFPRV